MQITSLLTPEGNDTEVQWNDNGAFGADTTFTFDDATNTLTVYHLIATVNVTAGGTVQAKRLLIGS